MKWQISAGTGFSLGSFKSNMRQRLTRAAAKATDRAAFGARDDIRSAMRNQRLGGLANVISATSDLRLGRPQGRGGALIDVAGFVVLRNIKSQRTAGALDAYIDNESTTISPQKGRWLAIATREIPRFAGRRRMTPALYDSTGLADSIGPLRFVPGKHAGVAYLVVEDATINLARQGKARRLPKRGSVRGGRARVGFVAFVLIRQTRRVRRVDPADIGAKWQQRLPLMLSRELSGDAGAPNFTSQLGTSFKL